MRAHVPWQPSVLYGAILWPSEHESVSSPWQPFVLNGAILKERT